MALQLTSEEFAAIKNEFMELDRNGDCKLTRSEIGKAYSKNKTEYVDFMMRLMDLDANGSIEFHEYLEMAAFWEYNKRITESKIKQMFSALDRDNNGVLSIGEVKKFCNMVYEINENRPSSEDIQKLIQKLDANGDGQIDCQEFMKGYTEFEKL